VQIFWGQAAAGFTRRRGRQEAAGGGLPTELRAQDQAPSHHLPSSGVGWRGDPLGDVLPVGSGQDSSQLESTNALLLLAPAQEMLHAW